MLLFFIYLLQTIRYTVTSINSLDRCHDRKRHPPRPRR